MKISILVSLLSLVAHSLNAQTEQPQAKKIILQDKRIIESSGLTRSLRYPGLFWTHNDSGGEPCVFAINRKGETKAKVRVPKAANFDWEDITSGLNASGQPCLYIGDIGDNLKIRPTLQIYEIPEPDLPEDARKETESAPPKIYHLTYPKGRHNAESLMVHPQTHRLYLLTKEENGRDVLYQVPEPLVSGQALRLAKVTDLNFPALPRTGKRPSSASLTTSAEFSPDGKRLIVATYSYLCEWELSRNLSLEQSLQAPPHLIEPPLTSQMEAVCYDADSRTVWFTSEQLPSPLYRLLRN